MLSPTSKYLTGLITVIFLLLALVTTYFAYRSGLNGTFIFDDNVNILNNGRIAIHDFGFSSLKQAALSGYSGPMGRPVSMLSFAINHAIDGYNAYDFKLTNLFIHFANGLGIFALSIILLKAYRKQFQPSLSDIQIQLVSLATAAAWLLHPFNLTSVLYVVQRMTSLSALFAIWGLVLFTWGRYRILEGKSGVAAILTSLLVFTPLSIFSKETGALMPAFMFIMEISLFRLQANNQRSRHFLLVFFALTFVLPAVSTIVFTATHPAWILSGYRIRDFTLTERVMTEARVIWFYLRMIVLPNITDMGLFHDDIVNSQDLFTPITTLPAIAGIIGLAILSWISRKKAPLVTFGILFFFTGHALESSIFSLEIAYEHRNYLPMFGILLPMFFYLLYPMRYENTLRMRQIVAILIIGLFTYDTWVRANDWSTPVTMAQIEVQHHPLSARNNGEIGNHYAAIEVQDPGIANDYYLKSRHFYEQATAVNPNYTLGLFGLLIVSAMKNKPVDPQWVTELTHRLQFAPSEATFGDQLVQLLNCEVKKICQLSKQDMEGLFRATLQNTTVTGPPRALVLAAYSTYLIDIAADYPAALKVMHETIDTAPQEISYRLTLIEFLIALQKTDEARQQLDIVKSMDKIHAYQDKIAGEEKLLAQHGVSPSH